MHYRVVYEAVERRVFPTQEELTMLNTFRNLKAEAKHMIPPYSSVEHEDSELY